MTKPKAQYTEQGLHDAFICGVKYGQGHAEGDPEPQVTNWKDALFYEGFQSDILFSGPGYHNSKPAKADK
jgi:hypothetical protein